MTAHWRPWAGLLLGLLGVGVLPGCVERRYTVFTEPVSSAMVLEDGRPVGPTPATKPFDFYGVRKFTVMRDGFQTVDVFEDLRAPWWAYPPFDFITENLIPWVIRDFRDVRVALQPMPVVPAEQARDRAMQMRGRANEMAPPTPPAVQEGPVPQVLPQTPQEGPVPKVLPGPP
jgi:hypothetical protein